ncbi:MAG: RNA polymerase factor sigma-54 [Phycisphaerae bacterium]|nr:RNA polymerase factor sigma-54 [Phycisphaerae bacterium]
MSQTLSQIPRHLLQQQQRLTPQLIQAMDILQLNALALEERLAQELDANPALELAPGDDDYPTPEPAGEEERPEGEQALVVGDAREFERLDNLVREYDWFEDDGEHRGTRSRAAAAEEGDVKLEAMANTAARSVSLIEHLEAQWALTDVDDETRRLGVAIINALDENGRLPVSLDELLAEIDPPAALPLLKDALARVQQLDPPGIAARSVQECLVLQLEAQPGDTQLARRIIEDHFDDLRRNRLPQIAKALRVEIDQVKAAIEVIRRLSLHPGLEVVERATPTIVPDLIVEYNDRDDGYDVRLTRANQRDLRISEEFRAELENTRGNKQAREFIRSKIDAAAAIIDAFRFRRERLLEVARAVFQAQREFLEHGEQHIRVLRMSDMAAQFGCDPSTISRTVDDKWVQTPRGIYPLRRFFTGGKEDGNGEALGWDSIKAKVQEIVSGEDKASPLSDDEIVAKLEAEGISIKRRTVAKYRAQLNIPSVRERREY